MLVSKKIYRNYKATTGFFTVKSKAKIIFCKLKIYQKVQVDYKYILQSGGFKSTLIKVV